MQFRVKRLFLSVSLFLITSYYVAIKPWFRISLYANIFYWCYFIYGSCRLLEKWLYAESAHENNKWFGNFILVNLLQVTFWNNSFKFLLELGNVYLI